MITLSTITFLSSFLSMGPTPFLISPASNTNLCLAPVGDMQAAVGAKVTLQTCDTSDESRFWSWGGVVGSSSAALVWEGNGAFCVDVGTNPTIVTVPTLQPCGPSSGQQWSRPSSTTWSIDRLYLGVPEIMSGFSVVLEPGSGVPGTNWSNR